MKALVAGEFSGAVRDALRARGYDAWSCDLLATERGLYHIQAPVESILGWGWDFMVAHPPCTRLTNSGVRWLHERNLWAELDESAAFFRLLLDAPIPHIGVENPIPHRYALERIGRKYDQVIQPWQFGHGEIKATCFWLKGLPPLVPTQVVEGRTPRVHRASPGPDRWKERSRTLPGIAAAIADQWGGHVANALRKAA